MKNRYISLCLLEEQTVSRIGKEFPFVRSFMVIISLFISFIICSWEPMKALGLTQLAK